MTVRWLAARAVGFILRRLPRWYRFRIYSRLVGRPFAPGVFNDWVRRPVQPHNYVMNLDMTDWMERFAAIGGMFYELEAVLTVERRVGEGDVFVDVGGNIGFISLTASRIVGAGGKVFYVEPNARLRARFADTISANNIANVEIVSAGFGATDGEMKLQESNHHGLGRLASGTGVKIVRGDILLPHIAANASLFVKIDVEGFEEIALAGMPEIRSRPRTQFLVEVTDAWLRERGGGAASLIAMMAADGYDAYLPVAQRDGSLEFRPVAGPLPENQYDLLFTRALE